MANFEASLVGLQTPFAAGNIVDCLSKPLTEQRVCRDTIVQALMIAIDLRYEEFEIGFFDTNRYAGFGATLAALGLSTAGAVVSGGTSQLLSAAAAGVIGAREAFKREVLVEQTSVALLTAMRAQRDKIGLNIRLGLRRDATQYPLGAALADVSGYYRAGTIVGALTGVTEAVALEREQAREDLQQSIVNPQFVPPPVRGSGAAPSSTTILAPPASAQPSGPSRASPPPPAAQIDRPRDLRPLPLRDDPYVNLTNDEFKKLHDDVFRLGRFVGTTQYSQGFTDKVKSFQKCLGKDQTGFLTRSELTSALGGDSKCIPTTPATPAAPQPLGPAAPQSAAPSTPQPQPSGVQPPLPPGGR
jgi:hypothetical protein